MTYTTHTHDGRTLDLARFDDVLGWLDAARRWPASPDFRAERTTLASRRPCKAGDSYYGGASFADALRLAREGWPEGRRKMLADLEAIRAGADAPQRTQTLDVCGAYPHAAAAAAGDPMNMHATGYDSTPRRRVLTVRLWIGVLAIVSDKAVAAWGAAAASHVDALESAGWQIDLHAVAVAATHDDDEAGRGYQAMTVRLKAPDQPLDLDRLAFVTAHAAAHRRINFAIREATPTPFIARTIADQMGYSRQPDACPAWVKAAMEIDGPAIDIPSANAAPSYDPKTCAAAQAAIIAKALASE